MNINFHCKLIKLQKGGSRVCVCVGGCLLVSLQMAQRCIPTDSLKGTRVYGTRAMC